MKRFATRLFTVLVIAALVAAFVYFFTANKRGETASMDTNPDAVVVTVPDDDQNDDQNQQTQTSETEPTETTEATQPQQNTEPRPADSKPQANKPQATEPQVTEPQVTEPQVTEPAPQPAPIEPAPQPAPTEPAPTEPAPTEPAPQPEPTEPVHTHEYVATVVAPTCVSQGCTTFTCKCGHSYNADFTPITAHDYTHKVVAPTTTSEGYTQHTCKGCGVSYQDNFVEKLVVEDTSNGNGGHSHGCCNGSDDHLHVEETRGVRTYVYCEYVTNVYYEGNVVYWPYSQRRG